MYTFKAFVRSIVFYALRPLMVRGTYDDPSEIMGYTGWFRLRGTNGAWGCIAFTHQETGLQFKW